MRGIEYKEIIHHLSVIGAGKDEGNISAAWLFAARGNAKQAERRWYEYSLYNHARLLCDSRRRSDCRGDGQMLFSQIFFLFGCERNRRAAHHSFYFLDERDFFTDTSLQPAHCGAGGTACGRRDVSDAFVLIVLPTQNFSCNLIANSL